jgi:LacI family gluconate utilization system Gnt-I transcriptional repressor
VARLAGVSGMTVSRVLRDAANVSEETRQRVQAAVSALGYVPNRLAGALASARTRLVVVILPSLGNIVFPEVLRGANERLEADGYQAVIGVSDYDPAKEEQLIETMQAWRPSGVRGTVLVQKRVLPVRWQCARQHLLCSTLDRHCLGVTPMYVCANTRTN